MPTRARRCEVVNALLDLAPPEGEDSQAAPPPAQLPTDFPVVVDAADSPARLAAVLESLREAGAGRVFTVFGCDGVVRVWRLHWRPDALPGRALQLPLHSSVS